MWWRRVTQDGLEAQAGQARRGHCSLGQARRSAALRRAIELPPLLVAVELELLAAAAAMEDGLL